MATWNMVFCVCTISWFEMLTLAKVLCFHFLFSFSSSIPMPNTSGWYLTLYVWEAGVQHIAFISNCLSRQEWGPWVISHTSNCSDYMKYHLKYHVCVTQILKLSDLMVPLNLKSMDCILILNINISEVLCIQLSNIESLACHVLIMLDFHWSQRENVAHGFWGNFFFHCNVGSVMAVPKICWCNFSCQCFESGMGEKLKIKTYVIEFTI